MRVGRRDILFLGVVLAGAVTLSASALGPVMRKPPRITPKAHPQPEIQSIVTAVDAAFRETWTASGFAPAHRAPDLAILRRLDLALKGSIPSLEEIRRFESRKMETRIPDRVNELLSDHRTGDYLAERFARAFVGTEDGPFLRYRRRRFVAWLSDAINANRPYGAIVRDLIADNGLWTDHPATNFITVTYDEQTQLPSPERLGARTARAFLGVRIDCAQCHDHPFQSWKQADFRGLAAFFGATHSNFHGTRDEGNEYRPLDRKTHLPVEIKPKVPFREELLPNEGSPRARLAAWVVDPRNRDFSRATVNRVWALVTGRPLVAPIDDLRTADAHHPALDLLADDFAAHGHDLHRLIRTITASEAFQLASEGDDTTSEAREDAWAVFPMTRIRPEQVALSLFQEASTEALDSQAHWLFRLGRLTGVNDFVRRFGDVGEDEFDARGGTIPQRLLLMNGRVARERIEPGFTTASTRIALLAPSDSAAVQTAYLAVLTRGPTPEESSHFAAKLAGSTGKERRQRVTDLFWALINSTEFSWNH